jgi:choline dehydrogenase-like flavoprotein
MQAMIEKGLPLDDDMFTTGATPHGCGHAVRTIHNGTRATSTDYLKEMRAHKNLTIKTNSRVDKVIMDRDGNDLKAVAVQVVNADGTNTVFQATREIIISGGAYCSPVILMRSGIGAKAELNELGITCIVDLPGVGKNLMDHVVSSSRS